MSNTGYRETLEGDMADYACGRGPSPFVLLRAPIIENWSTEVRPLGKAFKLVVRGQVWGHPDEDIGDGDQFVSAALIWFDRKHRWCRTTQRVYRLGEHAGDEIPVDGIDA